MNLIHVDLSLKSRLREFRLRQRRITVPCGSMDRSLGRELVVETGVLPRRSVNFNERVAVCAAGEASPELGSGEVLNHGDNMVPIPGGSSLPVPLFKSSSVRARLQSVPSR